MFAVGSVTEILKMFFTSLEKPKMITLNRSSR